MRKPIVVGNWKMFTNIETATNLSKSLKENLKEIIGMEMGVCPPFTYLTTVKSILEGSNINLGAQNSYWKKEGAFTGEVSPDMLKDIGCKYAIVGHSERRHQMNETDEMVNNKIKACLASGLTVILCIGELIEEMQENKTETVLRRQLETGLAGITPEQTQKTIIAYEPVWAIGTGKTATPDLAQKTHSFIRKFISNLFNETIAQNMRIMYGGSVKPGNIAELSAQTDIDGALVGGASLKADSFTDLILNYKK